MNRLRNPNERGTVALNFRELGQGPALIILHGLFGSLDNWLTLGRRLATDFSVYLVDQRNHGRSPHTDQLTYPLMADDLLTFFDQHGIRQASVLGHSMGGKTAMQFALDHPDRCEALLVADMSPRAYAAGHEDIFAALEQVNPQSLSDRDEAEAILSQHIVESEVRQFLMKNLSRNKGGSLSWKMNLPVIRKEYEHILEPVGSDFTYDGPACFIRGGLSNYISEADRPKIQSLFPRAEFIDIPGAGHWLHADQPDLFYKAVQDFLHGALN